MKGENFDRHKFRVCVEKARNIILENDIFSLEGKSLLAQLIYNNTSIERINFETLNWETILINYTDWVDYYNVNENRFNKIKQFLIDKINQIENN